MAYSSVSNVRFAGLSVCVPANTESNWELPKLSDSEKKNLVRTIGVETRRVAPKELCVSDMCVTTGEKLLGELGWRKEEIEAIILVTQSGDRPIPATACALQHRLGLPESCLAFDVNLGCSGYPYGLYLLGSLLANGMIRKGILFTGDTSTRAISPYDRSVLPLFSDSGAATALEYCPGAPEMAFEMFTDGGGFDAITVYEGGARAPTTAASMEFKESKDGLKRRGLDLVLNGVDVFNFTITKVPASIKALLERTGTSIEQVDAMLLHQANRTINDLIRKKLKASPEQCPHSLPDFGNTSINGIPVTAAQHFRERLQSGPMTLLLSGFGVGLSWANAIVRTDPPVFCGEIMEM